MLLLRHVKSEPLTPPHLLLLPLRPFLGADVYLDLLAGRLLRGSLAGWGFARRRSLLRRSFAFGDGLLLDRSFGFGSLRGRLDFFKANLHLRTLRQHEILDRDRSITFVRLDSKALRLDGSFSFPGRLERRLLNLGASALEGDLRALQYIDR